MSNNKLSLQLNVDDFLPASDEEKESLSVLRKSVYRKTSLPWSAW